MPYSDDLRQSVLHAVDTRSLPKTQVARLFGVSLTFVKDAVRRRATTGSTHALPHGGGTRPKLNPEQQEALRAQLAAHPAALLCELAHWLDAQFGVSLSVSALSRLLRRLGLPRKKERGMPRSATRPSASRNAVSGATR